MDFVINVVSQFKTFAGNDGSSNTLNKEEFNSLVASQLPAFVKNTSDTGVIEQLIGSLDENNAAADWKTYQQARGLLANKNNVWDSVGCVSMCN
uniref:protein S100-A11-like n=1 Tax=Oncorhynchus gorbuscha TaxID=8017 RepID=UPI001EAF36E3|nr:protein S100-A11-like [Oncorhynchus gorbuscha]